MNEVTFDDVFDRMEIKYGFTRHMVFRTLRKMFVDSMPDSYYKAKASRILIKAKKDGHIVNVENSKHYYKLALKK